MEFVTRYCPCCGQPVKQTLQITHLERPNKPVYHSEILMLDCWNIDCLAYANTYNALPGDCDRMLETFKLTAKFDHFTGLPLEQE